MRWSHGLVRPASFGAREQSVNNLLIDEREQLLMNGGVWRSFLVERLRIVLREISRISRQARLVVRVVLYPVGAGHPVNLRRRHIGRHPSARALHFLDLNANLVKAFRQRVWVDAAKDERSIFNRKFQSNWPGGQPWMRRMLSSRIRVASLRCVNPMLRSSFDITATTDYGVPSRSLTVTAGVCDEQSF
jgi:hypothetical protein